MPIIVDHSAGNSAFRNIAAGVGASVGQHRQNKRDEAADQRAERGMTLQEMAFQRLLGRDERSDMQSDRAFEAGQEQFNRTFDYRQERDQIGDARYDEAFQYEKARNGANFALRIGEVMENARLRRKQEKQTELGARMMMADQQFMRQRGQELGLDLPAGMSPQAMMQAIQSAESQAAALADQESAIGSLQKLMQSGMISEPNAMALTDMIEGGDIQGARRQMAGLVASVANQQHEAVLKQQQMQVLQATLNEKVQTTPMTTQEASTLLALFEAGLIDADGIRKTIEDYSPLGVNQQSGRQGANIAGVDGRVDIPRSAIAPQEDAVLEPGSSAARYWERIAKQTIQPARGEREKDYRQRVENEARILAETEGGWTMPGGEEAPEVTQPARSSPSRLDGANAAVRSAWSVMGAKPAFEGTIGDNFMRAAEIIGANFSPDEITPELASKITAILQENAGKDAKSINDIIKQLKSE